MHLGGRHVEAVHLLALGILLSSSVAHASTTNVSSSSQLSAALLTAAPGDVIVLADGPTPLHRHQERHHHQRPTRAGPRSLGHHQALPGIEGHHPGTDRHHERLDQTVDGESMPVAIWFEASTSAGWRPPACG